MELAINPNLVETLPLMVKSALSKMTTEEQMMFQEQYEKKSKSTSRNGPPGDLFSNTIVPSWESCARFREFNNGWRNVDLVDY